jgi:hypothetical protein
MLRKYPAIKDLHKVSDHLLIAAVVLGISLGHLYVASYLVGRWSLSVDLLLAATVGSFFAFGFQAMNHILMHSTIKAPKGERAGERRRVAPLPPNNPSLPRSLGNPVLLVLPNPVVQLLPRGGARPPSRERG